MEVIMRNRTGGPSATSDDAHRLSFGGRSTLTAPQAINSDSEGMNMGWPEGQRFGLAKSADSAAELSPSMSFVSGKVALSYHSPPTPVHRQAGDVVAPSTPGYSSAPPESRELAESSNLDKEQSVLAPQIVRPFRDLVDICHR